MSSYYRAVAAPAVGEKLQEELQVTIFNSGRGARDLKANHGSRLTMLAYDVLMGTRR